MKIVGIDPGSLYCGYAALEVVGTELRLCDLGVWDLVQLSGFKTKAPLGIRLENLHLQSTKFFKKWNPHYIGFELAIHHKNVKSALVLSEARGIVRLAAHQSLESAENRIFEMSPTSVKKHTSGWGSSKKEDLSRILALRFRGLDNFVKDRQFRLDAFDALGIAWTAWILSRTEIKKRSYGIEHRS